MKKILFVLVAMLTMVFTGCKVENSKVTVSVQDTEGAPVKDCPVIYADYASIGVNFFLPSPDPTDEDNVWEYLETNAQGIVTKNILLAVPKLKYCFAVYDRGSNEWITKDVELVRGTNEEIEFVVNK